MIQGWQLYKRQGFTIIELLIAVVVIGILASITLVSYSGAQRHATETVMRSDLSSAKDAMDFYRIGHNEYPTTLPASFTPSKGVTLMLTTATPPLTYCIEAHSDRYTTMVWHITDSTVGAQGSC